MEKQPSARFWMACYYFSGACLEGMLIYFVFKQVVCVVIRSARKVVTVSSVSATLCIIDFPQGKTYVL